MKKTKLSFFSTNNNNNNNKSHYHFFTTPKNKKKKKKKKKKRSRESFTVAMFSRKKLILKHCWKNTFKNVEPTLKNNPNGDVK